MADAKGSAGRVDRIFTFRGKSSDGTLSNLLTFSVSELCKGVEHLSEASGEPVTSSGNYAFAKEPGGSCPTERCDGRIVNPTGSSAHSGRYASAKERDDSQPIHEYGDNKFSDSFAFVSEDRGTCTPANPARALAEKSRNFTPTRGMPTDCLLYTSPSPRDLSTSRMPSSA